MSAEKLMDALQYLDEDILEQAEKMRTDGVSAEQPVKNRANKVIWFRRASAVAALAAACVLAVFTLRFVGGIKTADSSGASSAPAAYQEAAAEAMPEEEKEEYAVNAAGTAEETVEEAAPAEEAAEEYAIAEEAAEADMEEYAAAEVPAAEAAVAEEPAAEASAMSAGTSAAGNTAMSSAKAAASQAEAGTANAEARGEAEEAEPEAVMALMSAADTGLFDSTSAGAMLDSIPDQVLAGRQIEYDGSLYSVESGGKARRYRYLLEKDYTDPDGTKLVVYLLSNTADISDEVLDKALSGALSADDVFVIGTESAEGE